MQSPKSKRELYEDLKYDVISRVLTDPDWTALQAAKLLQLTVRQVRRLIAKVKVHGRDGIVHGNVGRKPAGTLPDRLHQRVVHLYEDDYGKFGYNYQHFTEALADNHQTSISRETARRWLRSVGLGPDPKRSQLHRRRRARCARMGLILFLDGSPHRWFGPGYPRSTLILATDDATGQPLYGILRDHEDRNGCFKVFYQVA
jgi:hypothetical protein